MATHDYDIANQSGAAFRTDLNNALAAIQSNNSNSSSPATTVAYQWWADTTNNVLKIRNSSNNDWVELLQLDGTLTLEDGSASTPGLAFRDDLNTGIFSSAADTFNVATAGVERMELGATTIFNEDGANVDFRIEGDTNANLFYLDAGNDRVGIGLNNPSDTFHVFHATDNLVGRFESGDTGAGITLKDNTHVTSLLTTNGAFEIDVDQGGDITGESIAFKMSGSEKARIDGQGRLLINTSSSINSDGFQTFLQIAGTSSHNSSAYLARFSANASAPFLVLAKSRNGTVGSNTVVQASDDLGVILFHGNDGSGFHEAARISAVAESGVGNDDLPSSITFKTNSGTTSVTEKMRLTSAGFLGVGITSPTVPLHVKHSSTNGVAIFESGDADGGIALKDNSTTANVFLLAEGNEFKVQTNAAERVRVDDSGQVGIGTTNPASMLHVSSGTSGDCVLILEADTDNNDEDDNPVIFFRQDGGIDCSAIGMGLTSTASDNFLTLANSVTNGSINFQTGTTSGFTNAVERMRISANGSIGAPNGTNIFNASDSRVKKNVVDLDKGLSAIKSLRPVSFNWIDGFCDEEKNTLYGFIAQEVQAVDSNLIQDFANNILVNENTIENVLRVNEKFLVPMLVKAVQELEAKVAALEAA